MYGGYGRPADGEPRASSAGRLAAAVVWAVLLTAVWLWGRELSDPAAVAPPDPRPGSGARHDPAGGTDGASGRTLPAAHAPLPAAEPWRVDIEAAGVHARIVERGLDSEGAVRPPPMDTPGVVGWYRDGPEPGTEGAALLVGHVDTDRGPAVFHRLASVRPGDRVRVTRADGTVAEFTAEDVSVAERADFDPARVYGARRAGRAELRLITCTGDFDRDSRSYTANLVVSAYLTGVRPAREPDTGALEWQG
ncbi:class F sortase [Streptomyces sp. TRM 70361]|uniref:class F sortase n=1 Tax=Streptomyces sp. TRM 70361 TaxID=3116553 RepID=UPI002E7B489F|nr:class F sortase [Streptomyces sp. TRM 70361]MEE1937916.1 class F sortase [Streptomyces sp. TRM 70361]